jgi:hypothetical protein
VGRQEALPLFEFEGVNPTFLKSSSLHKCRLLGLGVRLDLVAGVFSFQLSRRPRIVTRGKTTCMNV